MRMIASLALLAVLVGGLFGVRDAVGWDGGSQGTGYPLVASPARAAVVDGDPLRSSVQPIPCCSEWPVTALPTVQSADTARWHGLDLAPTDRVRVLTLEQWRWLQRHFPGREYEMGRIAFCESGWDVAAVGAYGERGWLQIHPIHATTFPVEALHDPEVNGQVGAMLLARQPDAGDWLGTKDGCREWNR